MLGQTFTLPGQAPGAQGTKLCHLLSDEALLRRLSGNTGEDCVSALRSLNLPDSFWTDEFKVVPCAKTYSHKWTLCPCAHIGETARRRCPRTVNYKAVLCPLVKAKKTCPLGDSCGYAHNVFEHWLHPSRYKTRLCSFGRNCNRSICFFAHSAEELRCVPCSDDKDGDEREYLMQIIMAQESGLLPASAMEQMQPAPIPPALIPGLMPDLSSALQQALQQPLPPSNRPSMSGLPDAATIISSRPSMSGLPDLMTTARASLSGLPDSSSAAAAVLRASMSGVPDAAGMQFPGRASLSGLPDHRASTHFIHQHHASRTSLNGLGDGFSSLHSRAASARPSLNGLPDASAAAAAHHAHASMLLSLSGMGSMQRAMSNDLNAAANMHRAMSNDLGMGAPFHAAAAMHPALSSDMGSSSASAPLPTPLNAAAAAAAMAMERVYSRELAAAGAGAVPSASSPLGSLERAYSQREMAAAAAAASGAMGAIGSAAASAAAHLQAVSSSRSLGSGLRRGGGAGELNLGHTPSINSVESDSLVQLRSGMGGPAGGVSSTGLLPGGGAGVGAGGGNGTLGFDALVNQQVPPRLSDPGANLQAAAAAASASAAAAMSAMSGSLGGVHRSSDSGRLSGLLGPNDLSGLESLLPLVNNALASGALALPGGGGGGGAGGMRRSNSGSASGRVLSPQLQDNGSIGSPLNSGSLTPLSTKSGGELGGPVSDTSVTGFGMGSGNGSTGSAPQLQFGGGAGGLPHHLSHHMSLMQQQPQQQQSPLRQSAGSPPGPADAAAYEAKLRAAAVAAAAGGVPGMGAAAPGGGAVDQAYLTDLVSRLQDQGVNKEQLVSSLSQLLAQLLQVGS